MKPDKKLDKEIKKDLDMQELDDDELEGVAGGAMQQSSLRRESDIAYDRITINRLKNKKK